MESPLALALRRALKNRPRRGDFVIAHSIAVRQERNKARAYRSVYRVVIEDMRCVIYDFHGGARCGPIKFCKHKDR
jgi:hypothetical protein